MKVLFLTNIPSPYMVNFFNELGKLCDLTVLFEKSEADNRDKSWNNYSFDFFKGIKLKGIKTAPDKAFCPQIIKYLKKNKYGFVVVTNSATPTGAFSILYMKIRGINYFIESEGGFAKSGLGFKEWIKTQIISGAQLYLSTNTIGDKYFTTYGAEPKKIVKYPFTSIYNRDVMKEPISGVEKRNLRAEKNISNSKVVVAVGRFIPLKYYEILIEAFKYVRDDVKLLIVGGGPLEGEYRKLISEYDLDDVIDLVDFKEKEELSKYYLMADLFVHPTSSDCWGLIINEAMGYGLPIITTDMCLAGIEMIEEDENGYIVPVGNVEILAEKINTVLKDKQLQQKMVENNLKKVLNYTFESMAQRHIEIFTDYYI